MRALPPVPSYLQPLPAPCCNDGLGAIALAAGLVAYTIFLTGSTTRIDEVVQTIRLIARGS